MVPCASMTSMKPLHVRAPANKAMGAAIKQMAGAAAQQKRVVVAKAAMNGVSAPGPASPLNIVFVSAEVSPWSKTGGLGDVVGGLPVELAKRCAIWLLLRVRC